MLHVLNHSNDITDVKFYMSRVFFKESGVRVIIASLAFIFSLSHLRELFLASIAMYCNAECHNFNENF